MPTSDYQPQAGSGLAPYYNMPQAAQHHAMRRSSTEQLNINQRQKPSLSSSQNKRESYIGRQQASQSSAMMLDQPLPSSGAMQTSADAYRLQIASGRSPNMMQQGTSLPSTPLHQTYPSASNQPYFSHQRQSASFSGSASASNMLPLSFSPQQQHYQQQPTDMSYSNQDQRQQLNRLSTLLPLQQSGLAPQSPRIQMSPSVSASQPPFLTNSPSLGPSSTSPIYPMQLDHTRVNSYSPTQYNPSTDSSLSVSNPRPPVQRSPTQSMLPPSSSYLSNNSPRHTAASQPPYQAPMHQNSYYDMARSQSQSAYHTPLGSTSSSPRLMGHSTPQPRQQSNQPRSFSQRGLRRIRDASELRPHVNAQPAGRRADPNGGFISVRLLILTTGHGWA